MNEAHPRVWSANHVSRVAASAQAEIEAVMAEMERRFAHCRHRAVVTDCFTLRPPLNKSPKSTPTLHSIRQSTRSLLIPRPSGPRRLSGADAAPADGSFRCARANHPNRHTLPEGGRGYAGRVLRAVAARRHPSSPIFADLKGLRTIFGSGSRKSIFRKASARAATNYRMTSCAASSADTGARAGSRSFSLPRQAARLAPMARKLTNPI